MTKRSGSSRRKKAKEQAAAAAAAVAYPPWVLLEVPCVMNVHGSSSSIADINTLAAGRTAAGDPIVVALCVAPPPEASRVCVQVQLTDGVRLGSSRVLAAHGDSVLIEVVSKEDWMNERVDHFVYNSGNAATNPPRPPSLSLLPRIPHPDEEELKDSLAWRTRGPKRRYLDCRCTGVLRRGEDELVVAELKMVKASEDMSSSQKVPELVLLRCGEWSTKRPPPISHGGGKDTEWEPRKVLPVGNSLLCWSHVFHSIIFSDVFDDEPTLRYVPFPMESPYSSHVCATSGGETVKLANTFPRCCCGDEGASKCRRSLHAYTIRTWILKMHEMTWAMDGLLDATEIWALDAYNGLPRVPLSDPAVSFGDPNTVTFIVCESYHVKYGDSKVWQVMVDMRRKSIASVFCYPQERRYSRLRVPMPTTVSDNLNSYPSRNNGGTSPPRKIHMDTAAPPSNAVHESRENDAVKSSEPSFPNLSVEPMEQASKEVSLEKKILMVLEEIPDLARDVMLKAYSILTCDNGRRFVSLLELPMKLRKDWLLIEIKAREACSIFSSCTKDVQDV